MGLGDVAELDDTPADSDVPRVALRDAGKYLHQRRLAGAVLAHEGMDLSRREVQINSVDRRERAVALDDAAHGNACVVRARFDEAAHGSRRFAQPGSGRT